MFIGLTGQELPAVLPINHGQPMPDKLYTILVEVTEEHSVGVWARLEKIFSGERELRGDFSNGPQYFLPWSAIRRAMLSVDRTTEASPSIGLYL
jgi:hypothetical protein